MLLNIIIWLIILWCVVRTVGYSVYTFREGNKTGGISVVFLAIAAAAAAAVFIG